MPAKYVRPYSKGQKNDFNDAEAIAEAVQRPTMKFPNCADNDQLQNIFVFRVRGKQRETAAKGCRQFRKALYEFAKLNTSKGRAPSGPEVHFAPGSMIGHSGTLPLLNCAAIVSSTILSFLRSETLRRISRNCFVSASIDARQGGGD